MLPFSLLHDLKRSDESSNEHLDNTDSGYHRDFEAKKLCLDGSSLLRATARQDCQVGRETRLSIGIEREATTYFFTSFVGGRESIDTTRGFLEFALPMFQAADEASPLHLAIEAVALSTLANYPGREKLTQVSARVYGQALRATQQAIQHPRQSTSDETLMTILLFALYESVTSSDHSVQAWTQHIEGAVAMVKARGVKQFESAQSIALFRAVRIQMLTLAVQQKKPIDDFPGPRGWLSDIEKSKASSFDLIEPSIQLPSILSKAKDITYLEYTPETTDNVTILLQEACKVQQSLTDLELYMPLNWGYQSVANVGETFNSKDIEQIEVWPGPIHIYKDVRTASIRNYFRISQMLCSSVVMDTLKWLHPKKYMADDRYANARNQTQAAVDDICYSVPFHLCERPVNEKGRANDFSRSGKFFSPGRRDTEFH